MEVDSLHHPLQRVNGFLVCPYCGVKTPSEIIMRSHLAGKKHRRNRTLAAGINKDASVLAEGADEVPGNSSKSTEVNVDVDSAPSPVTRAKNDATMAPMIDWQMIKLLLALNMQSKVRLQGSKARAQSW
jgi:hypothetical protein